MQSIRIYEMPVCKMVSSGKIDTNTEDYGTVLWKINNFLAKPFASAVADNNLTECWISSVNEWQQGGKHQ